MDAICRSLPCPFPCTGLFNKLLIFMLLISPVKGQERPPRITSGAPFTKHLLLPRALLCSRALVPNRLRAHLTLTWMKNKRPGHCPPVRGTARKSPGTSRGLPARRHFPFHSAGGSGRQRGQHRSSSRAIICGTCGQRSPHRAEECSRVPPLPELLRASDHKLTVGPGQVYFWSHG